MGSHLTTRFENQLLYAPIQQFGDVEFGLRRARDFVDPTELLEVFAGFSEHAQDLAVQAELVDTAWVSIRAEQHLIWPRRDANRPGRAGRHSARSRARLVADGRTGGRINGHVDGDLAQELALAVEHLDAAVTAVRHVDAPLRVHCNAMRSVELSRAVAGLAPRLEPVAVFIDLSYTRVDIAVADIDISGRIPGHVGDLPKHPVHRRQGRLGVAQGVGPLVRGFLFAPQDHRHAAFRIELDHHVRAFVRDPNVVILVDLHGVCERPGIQMMADLANE